MPFVQIKVIEGALTAELKKEMRVLYIPQSLEKPVPNAEILLANAFVVNEVRGLPVTVLCE